MATQVVAEQQPTSHVLQLVVEIYKNEVGTLQPHWAICKWAFAESTEFAALYASRHSHDFVGVLAWATPTTATCVSAGEQRSHVAASMDGRGEWEMGA